MLSADRNLLSALFAGELAGFDLDPDRGNQRLRPEPGARRCTGAGTRGRRASIISRLYSKSARPRGRRVACIHRKQFRYGVQLHRRRREQSNQPGRSRALSRSGAKFRRRRCESRWRAVEAGVRQRCAAKSFEIADFSALGSQCPLRRRFENASKKVLKRQENARKPPGIGKNSVFMSPKGLQPNKYVRKQLYFS